MAHVANIERIIDAVLAESGRVETFAGLFSPHLTLGDEAKITDANDNEELIGIITDISHSFGKSGFITSFSVDSGGSRGRTRLKDLISNASKDVESFSGKQTQTADGDEVEY